LKGHLREPTPWGVGINVPIPPRSCFTAMSKYDGSKDAACSRRVSSHQIAGPGRPGPASTHTRPGRGAGPPSTLVENERLLGQGG